MGRQRHPVDVRPTDDRRRLQLRERTTASAPAQALRYRAQAMRMKPTQKTLKSVYRTYIDVIHFKRTEKGRLGSGSTDAEVGL